MPIDFSHDFFQLFGQPARFGLEGEALEQTYRELQARVHPDRHVHLSDAEQRLAMQWATRVNEAFQTLKKPLSRAVYLLQLRGQDVAAERNTAMSPAFLMEQMEWREAVEDARQAQDAEALDGLHQRLVQQSAAVLNEAGRCLDEVHDDQAAADAVRRLMFLEKLRHDIEDALEVLES